jgi:hypothetical protein
MRKSLAKKTPFRDDDSVLGIQTHASICKIRAMSSEEHVGQSIHLSRVEYDACGELVVCPLARGFGLARAMAIDVGEIGLGAYRVDQLVVVNPSAVRKGVKEPAVERLTSSSDTVPVKCKPRVHENRWGMSQWSSAILTMTFERDERAVIPRCKMKHAGGKRRPGTDHRSSTSAERVCEPHVSLGAALNSKVKKWPV